MDQASARIHSALRCQLVVLADCQCHTYSGGYPGLCLQYGFHRFAVNNIVPVINDISSQLDFTPCHFIIHPSTSFALLHISFLPHVWNILKTYEAARTRAVPQVTDTGQDNSAFGSEKNSDREKHT